MSKAKKPKKSAPKLPKTPQPKIRTYVLEGLSDAQVDRIGSLLVKSPKTPRRVVADKSAPRRVRIMDFLHDILHGDEEHQDWLSGEVQKVFGIEMGTYQEVLPRRPLAVGDRVSFEGYSVTGFWREGTGVLVSFGKGPEAGEAQVRAEDGEHYFLGLRSFRRLVPRSARSQPVKKEPQLPVKNPTSAGHACNCGLEMSDVPSYHTGICPANPRRKGSK